MAQPAWVVRVRRARSRQRSRSVKLSDYPSSALSSGQAEDAWADWWAHILFGLIPPTEYADKAARGARAVLHSVVLADIERSAPRRVWPRAALQLPRFRRIPLRWASHALTLVMVLVVASGLLNPLASTPSTILVMPAGGAQRDRTPGDFMIQRAITPLSDADAAGIELPAARVTDPQSLPAFIESHTLVEGETLGQVAAQYNVSVATLFWANDLGSGNVFAAGQELRIPRLNGIPHIVQADETLVSIADQFHVRPQAIELFKANNIHATEPLAVGREIFIPGGTLPYPDEIVTKFGGELGINNLRAVAAGMVREDETNIRSGPGRDYPTLGTLEAGRRLKLIARHDKWVKVANGADQLGWVRADLLGLSEDAIAGLAETNDFPPAPPHWVWPTHGEITSPFGWRSRPFRSFHDGLDIANAAWTKIYAARSGRVIEAGWCSGFGYCVKIDHGDGVMTIYGHLIKKPPVKLGTAVEAGEIIGYMGSTFDRSGGGYSTGVHLHFTIKVNGKAVNPLKFLP
jgi:murein DD-endopeptidase MepM/ murein hydrolase activator NlpD